MNKKINIFVTIFVLTAILFAVPLTASAYTAPDVNQIDKLYLGYSPKWIQMPRAFIVNGVATVYQMAMSGGGTVDSLAEGTLVEIMQWCCNGLYARIMYDNHTRAGFVKVEHLFLVK